MISLWYRILPGNMLFMKNALLAILLVSPLYGLLSTMIVSKRMAFFSDALGHGAFTGIVIGAFFGLVSPLWSAILFSVFFSVVITWVRYKSKMSSDTVIGVFSSTAVALGLFLSTHRMKSQVTLSRLLVGDILSITSTEIIMLFLILILILIVWFLFFNHLLVVSVNASYAESRGFKVLPVELLYTSLIAVIVTLSMQWVGLLVINSLLVLPGATARNIAGNMRTFHIGSIGISVCSGVVGLAVSYYLGTATGATIVLVSACFFLVSWLLSYYR